EVEFRGDNKLRCDDVARLSDEQPRHFYGRVRRCRQRRMKGPSGRSGEQLFSVILRQRQRFERSYGREQEVTWRRRNRGVSELVKESRQRASRYSGDGDSSGYHGVERR
uniref:Uncharacterized protein n=1 Tax=Brassica oleracea var. oleracea TaxID=109376 RepID=A0A0D2ZYB0_BRAOL